MNTKCPMPYSGAPTYTNCSVRANPHKEATIDRKTNEPRPETCHGAGQWKIVSVLLATTLSLFATSAAHAEIAFRAAASATNNGGTSLTINKPAGVVSGDLMLAGISDNGGSATISGPSGWTLVRTLTDFTLRLSTWSKIAGSSEPSTYTWTLSSSRRICGGIVAFSGVDGSSPIQVENGVVEGGTSTTTHTTPTIATSGSSTWLLSLFADRRDPGTWSTWTPPSGTTERVDVHTQHANAGNASIEINTVGPVAAGNYSHTATASGSSTEAGMQIIALNASSGPPAAPSGLAATTASASQIDLTWIDNSSNETGFEIERKTGAGGTYAQIAIVGSNATNYSNTGLTASTTYYYRVRATNASGNSAYSNEANATTTGGLQTPYGGVAWAVPGRIEAENYDVGGEGVAYHDTTTGNAGGAYRTDNVDIKATADTGGGYTIGWFAPAEWLEYTLNVSSAGPYDFKIRVGSKFAGRTFHIEINGVNVTGNIDVPQMPDWDQYQTVTISGIELNSGQQTMGVVQGSLDGIDLNWIDIVSSGPLAAPTGLSAAVVSSSQINLSWVDNSSNETGFKIERKTGSGGTYSQIATVGANVTSFSNTGLTASTTYFYRVRATNGAGDSAYSNEASATTADSVPAAPSDLSATAVSGSQINLAWTDNSNNESGFKIERKTGSGGTYSQIATVGADVLAFSDTGLTALTTYFYRVRATNATGDSAYSNEASASTQAQQTPFGGVAWAVPGKIEAENYDVGGEGVAYHDTTTGNAGGAYRTDNVDIKASVDAGGGFAIGWFAPAEWLEYTLNVAGAGPYDFKIRVGSKFADRTFHIEINGVAVTGPINVPQMPDWDQYQTVTISGIELNSGQQTMGVVQGSLDGIDLNWIDIVSSGPPAAPTELSAAVVSSSQINLAWTDTSNNESGFKIERKTGSGGTYSQVATVGADVISFSDIGLTDNTTYFYRVRATNAAGDSAYSNEASATTADTVPAAPSDLSATAVSSSQINLAWTDNSNNETGFKIERKTGSGGTYSQIATVGADVLTFSDTGLTASTTYFYRVRATNTIGNSSYSNEASATTGGSGTAPAAPSNLIATTVSSSQINLSWTDNATDETGFEIERKTGSGGTYAQIATPGANATSFQDTGLSAGSTYFYRVRAVNASGQSAWSNEASATTQTSNVGPRAVSKPAGSVDVFPGNNIQNIVNANPAGTTFYIRSGVHRLQKITPRDGDKFVGELGAILKGSKVLTNWNVSGSNYYVTGQTQGPGEQNGEALTSFPRARYPEELFLDAKRLIHVDSLANLAAGKWFFDYDNDRIYMRDNPAGRTVETSVTDAAFVDGVSNVTIDNLNILQYASPGQRGTIAPNGGTSGWVVQYNAIGYNHGNGVKLAGTAPKLLNNYIYQSGMLGVSGGGTDQLVEGNEIAFNAAPEVGYSGGYAAGTKWVHSTRLIARGNYVHDNYNAGLWMDGNNYLGVYENNRVENNGHNGIFHEISYDAIIRNNTVRGNGNRTSTWFAGAGIFGNTSMNMEIYGNIVEGGNRNNIMLYGTTRTATGRFGAYTNKGHNVHNNTVTATKGRIGYHGGNTEPSTILFNNNTYFLKDSTAYFHAGGSETDPKLTKTQWQALGKDLNSTFTVF